MFIGGNTATVAQPNEKKWDATKTQKQPTVKPKNPAQEQIIDADDKRVGDCHSDMYECPYST